MKSIYLFIIVPQVVSHRPVVFPNLLISSKYPFCPFVKISLSFQHGSSVVTVIGDRNLIIKYSNPWCILLFVQSVLLLFFSILLNAIPAGTFVESCHVYFFSLFLSICTSKLSNLLSFFFLQSR